MINGFWCHDTSFFFCHDTSFYGYGWIYNSSTGKYSFYELKINIDD